MRIVPRDANSRPSPDGPGSFSPLQDTVSLACFVFKGTLANGNELVALLQDEKGTTYKLKRGDLIGENGGRISEITAKRITVLQLVRDGKGDWIEVQRYLFLGQDDRI